MTILKAGAESTYIGHNSSHARPDLVGAMPLFATKRYDLEQDDPTTKSKKNMCHSDESKLNLLSAKTGCLKLEDFAPGQKDVQKPMPPPPMNYKRKSVRDDTSSVVKVREADSTQMSEFRNAQRKHILNQVYESDIGEVRDGGTTGYTKVEIAMLEFILAPESTMADF